MGLGNGLAPNRRQAITWADDGPFSWRIYAALGSDELNVINSEKHHLSVFLVMRNNEIYYNLDVA